MNRYLPPLSPAAGRWLRFLALLLALLLLAWLVYDLRRVFTPLVAALAIAYIFNPLVSRLERRGAPRLAAIVGLYFVATVLLVVVGSFVTTRTVAQVRQLRDGIPGHAQAVGDWLERHPLLRSAPADTQPGTPTAAWRRQIGPLIQEHGATAADAVLDFLGGLAAGVYNWLTLLVLLPVYTFFFLWKFNDIVGTVATHLPAASRDGIIHVITVIDRAIANFFRGRLIVCAVIGLALALGWSLVGVPYSVPLGLLAGVLSLVPFLSLLVLPLALLAAYFGAVGAEAAWVLPVALTLGVYLLVQAVESFVLTPLIESRASGLHPLTTVVALLIGGQWAGLLGMLLAIPVASTLKVLAGEFILPELRRLASPATGAPAARTDAPSPPAEFPPSSDEKAQS